MTEKRFQWNERIEGRIVEEFVVDNLTKKELDEEDMCDLLNELAEETKLHKERISLLSSLLDLADAIIDTSDNEKAKEVWENKNEQTEKEWEKILNDYE